jgi:hypothetical protein
MPPSDADLMGTFLQLRKLAFSKLASPLRDAVLASYQAQSEGVKTAAELAATDKALFLHTTVP